MGSKSDIQCQLFSTQATFPEITLNSILTKDAQEASALLTLFYFIITNRPIMVWNANLHVFLR